MPLLMPTVGINNVDKFELEHSDSLNENVGGAAHATEWAFPYWDISMSTANMTVWSDRYVQWRGFLDALRGQKRAGVFHDPRKPYPTAYKLGFNGLVVAGTSAAFTGIASIVSFASRSTINLTGLPANFVLKRTDYVSFIQNDVASLHRIVKDVQASAAGAAMITIEPRVPLAYTTAAIVQFAYPGFTGIQQGTPRDTSNVESGTISFRAMSIVAWGGGNIMTTEGWVLENGTWDDNGAWMTSPAW